MAETVGIKEALQWFDTGVREAFSAKYTALANSGAVSDEVRTDGFVFARCVLMLTAESMRPLSPDGKAMLRNLYNF